MRSVFVPSQKELLLMSRNARRLALLVATTAVITGAASPASLSAPALAAVSAPIEGQPTPQVESASLTVEGAAVVTTVEVPAAPHPVQVSRQYSYDLYGTCWTRSGRPLHHRQRRIASVAMPQSAGSSQLRRPDDARTSFRFVDAAGLLAHPVQGTAALSCPRTTVPGVYRARVRGWTVRVLHFGGEEVVLTGDSHVELRYEAPSAP